ncbi:rCG20066 [Rattus norvegicus]|uniref:RCG20066 n=1 Tax=Rattus norvegicus TaxID=10116 RepID=A6JGZ9_RAT|nr:rCG20066 [Rattus norvegicus]
MPTQFGASKCKMLVCLSRLRSTHTAFTETNPKYRDWNNVSTVDPYLRL